MSLKKNIYKNYFQFKKQKKYIQNLHWDGVIKENNYQTLGFFFELLSHWYLFLSLQYAQYLKQIFLFYNIIFLKLSKWKYYLKKNIFIIIYF